MYVFGGYEEIIERFGQDVYRLDLTNLTWKLLVRICLNIPKIFIMSIIFIPPQACIGEPPVHRDFHSATAIGPFPPTNSRSWEKIFIDFIDLIYFILFH